MLNCCFKTLLGGYQDYYHKIGVEYPGALGFIKVNEIQKTTIDPNLMASYATSLILSISLLILLVVEFLTFFSLNYDYNFVPFNKYKAQDNSIYILDFFFIMILSFTRHLPGALGDEPYSGAMNKIGVFAKTESRTSIVKFMMTLIHMLYCIFGVINIYKT
jgi:hypothetical protein